MRRGICAVGVVALALGGLLGGAATAASASASGTAQVFVTPNNSTTPKHPGKIMFTGAIGDYGTVVVATAAGKPTGTKKSKSTYRLAKLKKGTILVNIATFQSKLTAAFSSPSGFNSTTCSQSITVTGSISVVSGTGAYTGIKAGSFSLTGIFAGITKRTTSGSCTTKTTTASAATYSSITGSGTVTVP